MDKPVLPSTTRDLLDDGEELRPVVDVAYEFGIHICARTAIRWCGAGKRGVPLEALKVAGRWRTTVSAFRRFLRRTSISHRLTHDVETAVAGWEVRDVR